MDGMCYMNFHQMSKFQLSFTESQSNVVAGVKLAQSLYNRECLFLVSVFQRFKLNPGTQKNVI